MEIAAQAHTARELLQPPGVAAAQHDVVGLERSREVRDDLAHRLAPTVIAETLAAALAQIVLEGLAVLVGHVAELGRLDYAIDDERGTESGPQPEKEHAAAPIATDGLHGRIVDEVYRPAERRGKVISHPARAEVVRIGSDAPVKH